MLPSRKASDSSTASRKARLVLIPAISNSRSAAASRAIARARVSAVAITLAIIGS